LVGHKKNISVWRRRAHDLVGVAARADHVGLRFHAGAAIDVSDDVVVLVGLLFQKLGQFFRWTRFRKRTAGIEVG
jgi:hypothetical protein